MSSTKRRNYCSLYPHSPLHPVKIVIAALWIVKTAQLILHIATLVPQPPKPSHGQSKSGHEPPQNRHALTKCSIKAENHCGETNLYHNNNHQGKHDMCIPVLVKQRLTTRRSPSLFPTVLLANVRSILNKVEEVNIEIRDFSVDAAILTETWLDTDTPDCALPFNNYQIIRKDRRNSGAGTKGGGIMVLLRDSISYTLIKLDQLVTARDCSSELLALYLQECNLLLLAIYHPFWKQPEKDDECIAAIMEIYDYTATHVMHSSQNLLKTVICGDFNDLRTKTTTLCQQLEISNVVQFNTRGMASLDCILSNIENAFEDPERLPPIGKSDHNAIFWKSKKLLPKIQSAKFVVRKLSPASIASFAHALENTNLISIVNNCGDDIDTATTEFYGALQGIYDSCFPLVTVRKRATDKPWVKPSLKVLINARDRAYSKHKTMKYLRLRDAVRHHIQQLKENFFREGSMTSAAKAWQCIRALTGIAKEDKQKMKCDLDINSLNSIFAEAFQQESPPKQPHEEQTDLEVLVVTETEVTTELAEMKVNKAPGIDGIPNWIFKKHARTLAPSITALFNCSLRTMKVPMLFKVANVTPVPKIENPTLNDYRPISLTASLSKILERLVMRRWILPSISPSLDPLQFAFIPGVGKGTACALSLQQNIVLKYLDGTPGIVRMLQIDLRKAFDKATHSVILDRLEQLKVPAGAQRWIWSFLVGRQQRVKYKNLVSDWIPVPSGVPQGSVLGPLLFALVVSTLKPISANTTLIKYADDLTYLHCIRSHNEDMMQKEMDSLEKWSREVNLPVNFNKTYVMDYTNMKICRVQQLITSDGQPITNVSTTKLLGMQLCANLKWDTHYQNALSKASRRLYILRQLTRAKCPTMWIWNAYNAFIRCVVSYGFPAACNIPQKIMLKIIQLEKRAATIIGTSPPNDSITQHLEKMCVRLAQQAASRASHPLSHLFSLSVDRSRRRRQRYAIPLCRTQRFKTSLVKFYDRM